MSAASATSMRISRSRNERLFTKTKRLSSRPIYRTPSTGTFSEPWMDGPGTATLELPKALALSARHGKFSLLCVTNSDVSLPLQPRILLLTVRRRIFLADNYCQKRFQLGVKLPGESTLCKNPSGARLTWALAASHFETFALEFCSYL